ncbi:hypothetical protein Tco_1080935 [Tanacetum coccineum]|uniref:Uncharacterized protein n=1 Tax=Tanacetum coccineum TaxID=301880 RepID=A0ABQ5HWK5_9ASTR
MVVCEICKPWGTINTKSNRSKSFERKCFCDFLVLEFILMRVLKSGKMMAARFSASFFVSDDNFIFLQSKSVLELQSWFCWHSELVGNACFFVALEFGFINRLREAFKLLSDDVMDFGFTAIIDAEVEMIHDGQQGTARGWTSSVFVISRGSVYFVTSRSRSTYFRRGSSMIRGSLGKAKPLRVVGNLPLIHLESEELELDSGA